MDSIRPELRAIPHVAVWLIRVEMEQPARAAAWDWLDEEERRRARAYHFDRDRWLYIKAHAWLRRILSEALMLHPKAVRLQQMMGRRPTLIPTAEHAADVSFSLSHTSGYVACAVSRSCQVGIDVESLRPIANLERMADIVCNLDEMAFLKRLPEEEKSRYFLELWTTKEAYAKSIGKGLGCPFKSLTARKQRNGFARVECNADPEVNVAGAWVRSGWLCDENQRLPSHVFSVAGLSDTVSIAVCRVRCGDEIRGAAQPMLRARHHGWPERLSGVGRFRVSTKAHTDL